MITFMKSTLFAGLICKCKTLIITQRRSPEVEREESHMRLCEILRRLSDHPAAHF